MTRHLDYFVAYLFQCSLLLYKAGNMTAEKLKVDPGLTVTEDVINSKRQISTVEHEAFIEEVTDMNNLIVYETN